MKRLALLAMLATPAWGHQTTFDQPDFLQMAGGDPVAAQELSMFCSANGKTVSDCKALFEGTGNLKVEAARKCIQRVMNAPKLPWSTQIDTTTAHQVFGITWHADYRTDADGEHRHAYSKRDRERAVHEYEMKLIRDAVDKKNAAIKGDTQKTATMGVSGDASLSAGFLAEAGVSLGGEASHSTTITLAKLTKEELVDIAGQAKAAHNDPSLGGVSPSIVCIKSEKDCLTSDGSKVLNESYEPKKDKKESTKKKDDKGGNEKKDEKKKADNTPSSEVHNEDRESHVEIEHQDAGTWAGETTSDPGTAIATPALENDASRSTAEKCLTQEFTKLLYSKGSKTADPDSAFVKFKEERAAKLLRDGYCDESVYGRAYCQSFKNSMASTVDVVIQDKRREAQENALETLKNTGICNPNVLGQQFCKKEREQWDITPTHVAPKPRAVWTPGAPKLNVNPR